MAGRSYDAKGGSIRGEWSVSYADVLSGVARWALLEGRSADVLRAFPDACIDAIVTDPPSGISFLGSSWDDPEDGLWEDGFAPTGYADGRERLAPPSSRPSSRNPTCRTCRKQLRGADACACEEPDHDADPDYRTRVTLRQRTAFITKLRAVFDQALRVLKPGGHALVWALPRTSHWTATALEDAGFEVRDRIHEIAAADGALHAFAESLDPVQRESLARVVEGQASSVLYHIFGQGWPKNENVLKPAAEHWLLVRRPIAAQNVAANVLAYGTARLNIDGARNAGRWPAHLVLVHALRCREANGAAVMCAPGCPVTLLDAQSGTLKSGVLSAGQQRKASRGAGGYSGGMPDVAAHRDYGGDAGGASRFFATFLYAAKAPRSEREAGCERLPRVNGRGNHHPTVKSLALMRWLVRLVTPPGGLVLDTFFGSGSTGVAALEEGFRVIGIEAEAKYAPIARARLEHAAPGVGVRAAIRDEPRVEMLAALAEGF